MHSLRLISAIPTPSSGAKCRAQKPPSELQTSSSFLSFDVRQEACKIIAQNRRALYRPLGGWGRSKRTATVISGTFRRSQVALPDAAPLLKLAGMDDHAAILVARFPGNPYWPSGTALELLRKFTTCSFMLKLVLWLQRKPLISPPLWRSADRASIITPNPAPCFRLRNAGNGNQKESEDQNAEKENYNP